MLQQRYRLIDPTQLAHAKAVFQRNATRLVTDALSNARIQVTNQYLNKYEGRQLGAFRTASDTYLTLDQYLQVKHYSVDFFNRFYCY